MADTTNSDNNAKPGLGSPDMSQKDKDKIHSMGGKASAKSSEGVAGSTKAAVRGGEHSHRAA